MTSRRGKAAYGIVWTKAEDKKLESLVAAKRPISEIAGLMGRRTERAVIARAHRLGISLSYELAPTPRRWTKDELEQALRLAASGNDYPFIARVLNRSVIAVTQKIHYTRNGRRMGASAAENVDAPPAFRDPIRRSCLCCGHEFIADGRFERVCPPCKSSDLYRVAA